MSKRHPHPTIIRTPRRIDLSWLHLPRGRHVMPFDMRDDERVRASRARLEAWVVPLLGLVAGPALLMLGFWALSLWRIHP